MSDFGAFQGMPLDPYDDPRPSAKSKLMIPAIALIVLGSLSVLYSIGTSLMSGQYKASNRDTLRKLELNKDLPPEMKKWFKTGIQTNEQYMPVVNGFVAICGAVIAIGGYQMLTLSARWFCYIAAIVSVLPITITNCCCCAGAIFGIWAIIVMNLPDVRAGFAFQSHLANQK